MNRNGIKKNSDWKRCLWTAFIVGGLGLVCLQGRAAPAQDSTILIKAKSFEFDYQAKVITYIGDVDARQDNIAVRCQRLLAYFGGQSMAKPAGKDTFKIDKIVARNSVVVTRRTDGLTMHCEEAVYFQSEEKIEATGNPVMIRQGRNVTEGSKFTLFLKTDRIVGEGPTQSTIFKPSN